MKVTRIASIATILVCGLMVASCANTIRGVGKDAANTVNATQNAGQNVAKAAN